MITEIDADVVSTLEGMIADRDWDSHITPVHNVDVSGDVMLEIGAASKELGIPAEVLCWMVWDSNWFGAVYLDEWDWVLENMQGVFESPLDWFIHNCEEFNCPADLDAPWFTPEHYRLFVWDADGDTPGGCIPVWIG